MEPKTVSVHHDGESYRFDAAEHETVDQIHIYVKEIWWSVPTDAGVDEYIQALNLYADRLAALDANGWELISSDGEHLYFEKENAT